MKHQEVIFAVPGQEIYLDVLEGRPSGTPTATVYLAMNDDDTSSQVATTGVATVSSVNTTLLASASAGAASLSVVDATAIAVGRQYLVVNVNGTREWIEVLGVAGTTVTTRQPIVMDHASGASFIGTRITISLLDSWVADRTKLSDVIFANPDMWRIDRDLASDWPAGAAGYRVRWSYVVAGVTYVGISFFDVVRYQGKQIVSPLEVDRRFPGWLDRLGPDDRGDQGMGLLDSALQDLKLDALGDSQVLRRMRSIDVLRDLIMHKANVLQFEAQALAGANVDEPLRLARELYGKRYDQLLRAPKVPIDQTGNGGSAQPKPLPAFRR